MGKVIDISKYGKSKKGCRKRMFKMPLKLGVTSAGFVTALIVFALALIYLSQANKTATYGYEVEKFDKKIEELTEEKSRLELRAAKLRSTNKIKENLDKLNMLEVDPTKVSYYEMNDYSDVAMDKE